MDIHTGQLGQNCLGKRLVLVETEKTGDRGAGLTVNDLERELDQGARIGLPNRGRHELAQRRQLVFI